MLKRIQLIPLIVLLWCSGISLSSGLQYGEITVTRYLIPIVFSAITYYLFRFLFRAGERKDLLGMTGALAMLLGGTVMLRKVLIPSFMVLYNDISYKIMVCYGIDLGMLKVEDYGAEALVVAHLICLVTVISLYLYETCRPAVVTALPSFLLFMVSIAADGVPYGNCVIAYGGAMVIFFGMGRRGESVRKLLLLIGCTALVLIVVEFSFSWADVSKSMWTYRDRIADRGNSTGPQREEDVVPDEAKQKINFGKFSEKGEISYNGTIELYIKSREDFDADKLFLCGFYGTSYFDSGRWVGHDVGNELDIHGMLFEPYNNKIDIVNAFDRGVFASYAATEDYYNMLMDSFCLDMEEIAEEVKEGAASYDLTEDESFIDESLLKRIRKECPVSLKPALVQDAIEEVRKYFSEDFQYTLRPGLPPDGEDELEWFMFHSKSGYCTHYATAAAMLFRAMGIPARIAQGYMINGDRIHANEEISVYDYNAHAWTEIYIGGGWIPLDVTSYVVSGLGGGSMMPDQVGQAGEPGNMSQEKKKKEELEKEKKKKKKTPKETHPDKEQEKWYVITGEGVQTIWIGAGIFALCVVGAVTMLLVWRRRVYRNQKKKLMTEPVCTRLLFVNDSLGRFWKNMHIAWDYMDSSTWEEAIFRETVRYYLSYDAEQSDVLHKSIHQYVLCVYKSRFGRNGITEEEYEECIQYLKDLLCQMRKSMDQKKWKKLQRCNMVKLLTQNE